MWIVCHQTINMKHQALAATAFENDVCCKYLVAFETLTLSVPIAI